MTDEVKRLRKAFRLYKARRDIIQSLLDRKGKWSPPGSFVRITDLETRYRMGMEIAEAILEGRPINWYHGTWLCLAEQIRRTTTNYT